MISQRALDIGPKAREMVAALWSRSGASAAPAQISAPTTRTGQGIVWPAAAAAAPTPSQAAAPDRECAGPIMVFSRPQSFVRPSPVRRGQVETAAYRP